MKFLVTGGSGFIGRNYISRCIDLGHEVCNVDIVAPESTFDVSKFYYCNIENLDSLVEVFHSFQPEFVIHLAARTDLNGTSLADYSANIVGVENVCRASATTTSVINVVFASSMLVCKGGYIPKDIFDFNPDTVYGKSKVQSEIIVKSFENQLSNYCIIRPTSIWGPWFKEPYKNFFNVVLSGKFLHIGNRTATKTYGYVENSVNQIFSLAVSSADYRQSLIYIGDSRPLHISLWANLIAREGGQKKPLRAPCFLFWLLSKIGDFLSLFKTAFPMTSFRLKNMTTDNVLPCSLACEVNQFKEVPLKLGVKNTINWLNGERESRIKLGSSIGN